MQHCATYQAFKVPINAEWGKKAAERVTGVHIAVPRGERDYFLSCVHNIMLLLLFVVDESNDAVIEYNICLFVRWPRGWISSV